MSSFWPYEGPGISGDHPNVILVAYQPLRSQCGKFIIVHFKYNILFGGNSLKR